MVSERDTAWRDTAWRPVVVGQCGRCGEALFHDDENGPVDSSGEAWCWVPGMHDVPRAAAGPHELVDRRDAKWGRGAAA
jgi:hypothetical protein